jgi:hypothetical protein
MNSKKVKAVCKAAFDELMKLSPEELRKQIEEHKNGEFANLLIESGAADLIVKKKRRNSSV